VPFVEANFADAEAPEQVVAAAADGPAMPFGRWGDPDDAARLVAWLCSDDAQWITGQRIDSEGGFRRWR
jgi:3-oxoacyl-[acyl-carrier protein] reductase